MAGAVGDRERHAAAFIGQRRPPDIAAYGVARLPDRVEGIEIAGQSLQPRQLRLLQPAGVAYRVDHDLVLRLELALAGLELARAFGDGGLEALSPFSAV